MQIKFPTCIVLFLILLVLLSTCADTEDHFFESKNLNQELQIKKIDVFKLQKEDSLSDKKIGRIRVGFFKKHPSKNILVFYDEIFKQLLITRDDKIISIIGSKGRGPKEFINVSSFDFNQKGHLVIYDSTQQLVKIFNLSGALLESFKIDPSKQFAITARYLFPIQEKYLFGVIQREYLANLDKAWESGLIGSYNKAGNLIDSFGKYDSYLKSVKHYNVLPVINVDLDNSLLFSSHGASYRIQIYDLNTRKRIAYFGYKSYDFKEIDEEVDARMPNVERLRKTLKQSYTTGVYFTSKYVILTFQNLSMEWHTTKNSNAKQYYLAVYDRNTKDFVDEILLPYPLENIIDGKLYLLENDNPVEYTLGIYELGE